MAAKPLLTTTGLTAYLGNYGEHLAAEEVAAVVAAVEALVIDYHGALEDGAEWSGSIRLGALMLGARLYRRRNSPAGVESMGELGPVYVSRNDPDLSQLLGFGRWAKPRIG